jgi:hypothetical protein
LQIYFQSGKPSAAFLLPHSALEEEIKWSKYDSRCRINPDYPRHKSIQHISFFIQNALNIVDATSIAREKAYRIQSLGLHCCGDFLVFCTGDELIKNFGIEEKIEILFEPLQQKMAIDLERYSESDAVMGILKLIKLSPDIGRGILAQTLSGIMRVAYTEAGITPRTVLQIVGKSNKFKSAYTALLSQMYDRDVVIEPTARMNSTLPFIEDLLYEYCDSVVLLDDVHTGDSRSIMRRNEVTLEEITRRIGDNMGRGHMMGKTRVEKSPRSNVIATLEYPCGVGSTATRTLIAYQTEDIDYVLLQECQDEPLLVSTFYYYFINWYVKNYHEIVNLLHEKLRDFRQNSLAGVIPRLNDTFFCLCTGFAMFLHYCYCKDYVMREDAEELQHSFCGFLSGLVYEQNERYKQSDNIEPGDENFLEYLRTIYKGNNFAIASDVRQYKEAGHFAESLYDGLFHSGCLCLRKNSLVNKMREFTPAADINEIVESLSKKGALITNGKNKAKQISACNGKRFLFIPLQKLH